MYRVALLENDEKAIKSLESNFDWTKFSMEVVGRFQQPSELISYLKNNDIDVIFTEINMPDMSGLDLIEQIKTKMGRLDIIFVVASETSDYVSMRRAMRLGVVDYCKKPLERKRNDDVLSAVIHALKKLGKAPRRVEGRDFVSLLSYINSNYDKNLHLDDLSRKFYFNPNYLCMLFRRRLDTTFAE